MSVQEMLGKGNLDFMVNVDIVFVIDSTGSMDNVINEVKNSALSFKGELEKHLAEYRRKIEQLRVKVISFRDFYCDGSNALEESDFFVLPDDEQKFYDFVGNIKAKGGGDAPESSLEALAIAMNSDFVQEGDKIRHIVVLFTDDQAHRLEDYDKLMQGARSQGVEEFYYPENMPKTYTELLNRWNAPASCQDLKLKLRDDGKRLVLFAPDGYPWSDIELEFMKTIRKSLEVAKGGQEVEMDEVFNMLAMSI